MKALSQLVLVFTIVLAGFIPQPAVAAEPTITAEMLVAGSPWNGVMTDRTGGPIGKTTMTFWQKDGTTGATFQITESRYFAPPPAEEARELVITKEEVRFLVGSGVKYTLAPKGGRLVGTSSKTGRVFVVSHEFTPAAKPQARRAEGDIVATLDRGLHLACLAEAGIPDRSGGCSLIPQP